MAPPRPGAPARTRFKPPEPASGANRPDLPLLFSPDGQWLALGTATGVLFFDAATLAPRLRCPTARPVLSLAFTPDSTTVFVWRLSAVISARGGEVVRRRGNPAGHGGQSPRRPSARARVIACVRLPAASFPSRLLTWVLTVPTPM